MPIYLLNVMPTFPGGNLKNMVSRYELCKLFFSPKTVAIYDVTHTESMQVCSHLDASIAVEVRLNSYSIGSNSHHANNISLRIGNSRLAFDGVRMCNVYVFQVHFSLTSTKNVIQDVSLVTFPEKSFFAYFFFQGEEIGNVRKNAPVNSTLERLYNVVIIFQKRRLDVNIIYCFFNLKVENVLISAFLPKKCP